MSLLEEVENLAMDVNRSVQAMVFFMRTPPRVDTDQKFLDLAKVATTHFRALQTKTSELEEAYPGADTHAMALDLTIEAIQSFLVGTIRQIRASLTLWMEAQSSQSPGPSLDFLAGLVSEMTSLVQNVLASTKDIHRYNTGERLEAPKISIPQQASDLPDIHPAVQQEVQELLADPSKQQIDSFLSASDSTDINGAEKLTYIPPIASKPSPSPSFESLVSDYERQERKEARKEQKRANTPVRQITKREGIEIDSEFLDMLVSHLTELTAIFFNEDNNFGQKPADNTDTCIHMPKLVDIQAVSARERTTSLHTASIDMESFLNDNGQTQMAKMTSLHMKDIMSTMKDVLDEAPNVSWNSLRQLDVAIKDYATTVRDIVQLSTPEIEEVWDDEEDWESEESEEEEELPPRPKVTRLLTKEEELLKGLDDVSDALDALEVLPKLEDTKKATLRHAATASDSGSQGSAGSPRNSPRNWVSSSSTTTHGSTAVSTATGSSHTHSSGSAEAPGSPGSARRESRVTVQFPRSYSTTTVVSEKLKSDSQNSSSSTSEKAERQRPVLTATKSASLMEPTYEITDESVRQADLSRVPDRWSDMQAKSELQRTVSANGVITTSADLESSKLKSAFKFMSKIRKKASTNRMSTTLSPSSSSSASSPRDSKRRTVAYGSGGLGLGSYSGGSTSSGSMTPRKSMQLTGVLPTDPRLWLFEAPDDDSNIRISLETDSIVAGTIEKLVQRLTHDLLPDPDFVQHFLITHKCFIASSELLELLCLRWDSAPPQDMDPALFESTRLQSIRLRVYNVLKTWIERFWSDFANEPDLIERLKLFAAAMYHSGLSSASQTLTKLIQKNMNDETPTPTLAEPPLVYDFVRRSRHEAPVMLPTTMAPGVSGTSGSNGTNGQLVEPVPVYAHTRGSSRSVSPSLSATPASAQTLAKAYVPAILTADPLTLPRPLTILDFHPYEIARQLCGMEWELWKQVKNYELLDVAWTRKDKETRAPNVLNMIRFSNHVTNWLISEILIPDDPKERSVALNRCIWIVKALMEMRNFNAAMEALSAFHSSAIYRLKSTWNLLPASTWAIYRDLEKLMSAESNFKTYRAEYDRAVPPYTPYLGTHLSDLLFLEESIPSYIEGKQLVNFSKMEKTAQFIQTLELSQQVPYHFLEVPTIRSYIKNYPAMDPKDSYNRSLAVEARAKKPNRPQSTYRAPSTATDAETAPISSTYV